LGCFVVGVVDVFCSKACAYCFGVCFDDCFLEEALFRDGKSLSDAVLLFVFESSSGTSQKSDDSSFTGETTFCWVIGGIIFCTLSSAWISLSDFTWVVVVPQGFGANGVFLICCSFINSFDSIWGIDFDLFNSSFWISLIDIVPFW